MVLAVQRRGLQFRALGSVSVGATSPPRSGVGCSAHAVIVLCAVAVSGEKVCLHEPAWYVARSVFVVAQPKKVDTAVYPQTQPWCVSVLRDPRRQQVLQVWSSEGQTDVRFVEWCNNVEDLIMPHPISK